MLQKNSLVGNIWDSTALHIFKNGIFSVKQLSDKLQLGSSFQWKFETKEFLRFLEVVRSEKKEIVWYLAIARYHWHRRLCYFL